MPQSNIDFIRERLGAYPSPPDPRHYRVRSPTYQEVVEIPEEYTDLLLYYGVVDDQGNIGSCVGHCGAKAMEITNYLLDMTEDDLSPGWLYHWSRHYANIPPIMEGSTNLGLMKALNKVGTVTEECCSTDTVKPWGGIDPCENAEEMAEDYAIDSYWYVNTFPNDYKAAIYGVTHEAPYKMPDGSAGKLPLVTAYPVYESYADGYDDGVVPLPHAGEQLLGGHSSCICGWTKIDDKPYWINVNSWGTDVGDEGVFYLPESYPFYDAWLIHNGPRMEPNPSDCPIGRVWAGSYNLLARIVGAKTRLHALAG